MFEVNIANCIFLPRNTTLDENSFYDSVMFKKCANCIINTNTLIRLPINMSSYLGLICLPLLG